MVSWGQNTVFSFGSPGPSNPTPSSAAISSAPVSTPPSTSFSFSSGNSSTSVPGPSNNTGSGNFNASTSLFSFGTPSSGFLSSSAPTTSIPSSSGAGFFSAQSPVPSNSSSSALVPFSTTSVTPSVLTQTVGNSVASAALHASMHQEAMRLESHLLQLQTAYSSYLTGPTSTHTAYPMLGTTLPINTQCRFQHVFYDPITHQNHMERLQHNTLRHPNLSKEDGVALHLPKPTHFDSETWSKACVMNPNPAEYIPVLLSGAEAIHSRLAQQQSKADLYANTYMAQLSSTIEQLDHAVSASQRTLNLSLKNNHVQLKKRVVDILRKVEICRARNIPLLPEERDALLRVKAIAKEVLNLSEDLYGDSFEGKIEQYVNNLESCVHHRNQVSVNANNDDYNKHVCKILEDQRRGVEALKKTVKKDVRDLQIIRNGLS